MLNSLITIDDLLNAKEGEHYQFKEAIITGLWIRR